jgi:hypothetical protein
VIFAEDCLIQQSTNGMGVETVDRIQFKNPTNVGIEILEIPAEKYYKEIKVSWFPSRFQRISMAIISSYAL